MTVVTLAAWILTLALAGLAVLQLLVAAGRPWGRFVWGGQHDVLPTRLRIGSVISVLVYGLIALIVLDRAGVVDVVSDTVASVGTWVITAYFTLGIVANAASRSRSERAVMTPLCAVLAVCSLVVARS
jgi:hypothetical protein